MTTGKTIALTRQTFVGKVISLLFNMLSMLICCSMFSSNCCLLTCIQVSQEASKVVWYSHLFKKFPVCHDPHSQRLYCSNEAKTDFSGERGGKFPYFFYDPMNVGHLISGAYAFSKSSLCVWKFLVHVLLRTNLKSFEHYLASMWNEHNWMVVWTFFDVAFLWDWNENWPFLVLWPLLSFPNLLAYWVQHFHSIIFQDVK